MRNCDLREIAVKLYGTYDKKFKTTGTTLEGSRKGGPRLTSFRTDLNIVNISKQNRRASFLDLLVKVKDV